MAGVGDTGAANGAAAWGDYDNDGDLDLYVPNWYKASKLYRNKGDGTFTDVTTTAGVGGTGDAQGSSWGDYDDDGDLDLHVANKNTANLLYRNNGDDTFTDVATTVGIDDTGNAFSSSLYDFDNDGDLDLYVTNDGTANLLYRS